MEAGLVGLIVAFRLGDTPDKNIKKRLRSKGPGRECGEQRSLCKERRETPSSDLPGPQSILAMTNTSAHAAFLAAQLAATLTRLLNTHEIVPAVSTGL
jgi:hypothetical protein